jgi:hypothetical protein
MGIHGVRNLFENNESERSVEEEEADFNFTKDAPHTLLPPLAEGYSYEIQKLPSGRQAVVVQETHKENTELERAFPSEEASCGCGKYQSCSVCRKFQGDALDSPESRTLRHKD